MRKGGGGRFARLEDKFSKQGVKNPGALAAVLGRKKFGKQEFQDMAATGLRRIWRTK
jgi:hypothetical protein